MAFTDDFSGSADETPLASHTPSGGGAWTLGAEGRRKALIYDGALATTDNGSGGNGYWLCTDQGQADHATSGKALRWGELQAELAVRLVDEDNNVVGRIHGSGALGRRLSKRVGGTNTDLITSQGVSDEWRKVEVTGDQYSLYAGGTESSPTWVQVGSTQTVPNSDIPTTITRQGITVRTVSGSLNSKVYSYFEADTLGAAPATPTLTLPSASLITASSIVPNVTLTF